MKDFKSYSSGNFAQGNAGGAQGNAGSAQGAGNSNNAGSLNNAGNANNSGMDKNAEQTVNMAAMLAKAFEGKSEGQVLQTIIAQAEQGKRDGTLTNADLDNFYNTLAPLLDGFKKQKLRSIIARLKQI